MKPIKPADRLIETTIAMHESGVQFMRRILPDDDAIRLWDHYPASDAISPSSGARYFYHCHPVEERGEGEHGHFHLFLPRSAFGESTGLLAGPSDENAQRADVVHLIAIAISADGLPLSLFTVNRWVTDEWMYAADQIEAVFDRFDVSDAPGDPLAGAWLTAFVQLSRRPILDLLAERDAVGANPDDRDAEILSSAPIDLQRMIDAD